MYIGVDNGVTGTVGIIYNNKTWFFETPSRKNKITQKQKQIYQELIYLNF